jgi:hypothetical protein
MDNWKTDSSLSSPVIIDGPYYKTSKVPAAAATIYIGAIVFFTAGATNTVTIATADSLAMGIVMNTAHNRSALAINQTAGTALTKALFFGTSRSIDIAIPLPGCIVSTSISASLGTDLEVGTGLTTGLLGTVKACANTDFCLGRSLVSYNDGTGAQYLAMMWNAGSIVQGA